MNETYKPIRSLLRFREPSGEGGISAKQHTETMQVLAELLHCASDDIGIIETQEEGQVLMFEMPGELFERLLALGDAAEQQLRKLGVLLIKEILDEPYDLNQIRRMLAKMYSEEELRSFCERYFPEVASKCPSGTKRAQMIDALLDFAGQTSRIPHIFVLAGQRDAELFQKYEPYHLPPRIFPQAKKQQQRDRAASFKPPFFNLKLSEFFRASLLGSGLAAGLTFLLQRAMMAVNDAFFMWLLMGGIALIGMFTGEAVLTLAGHKRGRLLSLVGVGSYLFGSVLGNSLLGLSLIGFRLSANVLVSAFITGISYTIGSGLALLLGIFLAYKYTR